MDRQYTANTAGEFIIGGQTLTPGSAINVSGTSTSLGVQETDVIVETRTESISLDRLILSGSERPRETWPVAGQYTGAGSVKKVNLRFIGVPAIGGLWG